VIVPHRGVMVSCTALQRVIKIINARRIAPQKLVLAGFNA